MADIVPLVISYPDFKLNDVMDSEQFDANNSQIVVKVNEVKDKVNAIVNGAAVGGLNDLSISTVKLADGAVTSAKIADGTIATVDLSDASITTLKLADNSVTSAKIVDGTITTLDLADGAVTNLKLADGVITSAKILDGTIATAKIVDGAVTSAKIADGTIATIDLADASITTPKLALLSVTTAQLADNSITSAKIVDGAIVTADIADGSITSAKIVDGTIVNADISPTAAIDGSKFANLSITSAQIADATIVNADISPTAAIDASKIGTGIVSNAEFGYLDGVTSAIQPQINNITLGQIPDGSLTDIKLSNTSGQIKDKLAAHMTDYVLQIPYVLAGGPVNAYTATLSPPLTAYVAGVAVALNINTTNTGASTININGLGVRNILTAKGLAMTAGKLNINGVYTMRYNGSDFILQGEGVSGNATASDLLSGKTAGADVGDIVGNMVNNTGATTSVSSLNDSTGGKGANMVSIVDGGTDQSLSLTMIPSVGFYDGVNSKLNLRFWGIKAAQIAAGTKIGWNDGTAMVGTYTNDANATTAQILNAQTAYVNGAKITGTMPDNSGIRAASTLLDATAAQRLYMRYPQGYGNTDSWVYKDDPNFIAANILSGKSIFGLAGTLVQGKPYAEGNYTISNTYLDFPSRTGNAIQNTAYVEITGLNFPGGIGSIEFGTANNDGKTVLYTSLSPTTYDGAAWTMLVSGNAYVTNTGFRLSVLNAWNVGTVVMWRVRGV